jgi:hypothetical protein
MATGFFAQLVVEESTFRGSAPRTRTLLGDTQDRARLVAVRTFGAHLVGFPTAIGVSFTLETERTFHAQVENQPTAVRTSKRLPLANFRRGNAVFRPRIARDATGIGAGRALLPDAVLTARETAGTLAGVVAPRARTVTGEISVASADTLKSVIQVAIGRTSETLVAVLSRCPWETVGLAVGG